MCATVAGPTTTADVRPSRAGTGPGAPPSHDNHDANDNPPTATQRPYATT